eukprot:6177426-Pleurochrysis_carterae.AAC.1
MGAKHDILELQSTPLQKLTFQRLQKLKRYPETYPSSQSHRLIQSVARSRVEGHVRAKGARRVSEVLKKKRESHAGGGTPLGLFREAENLNDYQKR